MEVAHISVWRRDPERFWGFYGHRFAALEGKQPNGAHLALAQLGIPVITQNIDGLHALAGSQDVIEVHGSIASASCLACGATYPLAETRRRFEETGVPLCDCGRPLKPDVVLFGEMLDEAAMTRASALAAGADLMLCIGSSLEVWPVAELPRSRWSIGGAVRDRHPERDAVRRSRCRAPRRRRRGRARGRAGRAVAGERQPRH